MKQTTWKIVFITILVVIGAFMLCSKVGANEDTGAMITADGGFFAIIGPDKEAQVVNGLGAGVNYRPVVTDETGLVRPSKLVFSILMRQGDPNVGKAGLMCKVGSYEGVDIFLGGSAMGLGDDLGDMEIGGMLEAAAEFNVGNQALSVRLGGGYLSSSRYPISASIGARTP